MTDGFGEVGPIGDERLVEIGPAFEARAVAPLQQRFAAARFGAGRVDAIGQHGDERNSGRDDAVTIHRTARRDAEPCLYEIFVARAVDPQRKRGDVLIDQNRAAAWKDVTVVAIVT